MSGKQKDAKVGTDAKITKTMVTERQGQKISRPDVTQKKRK